MNKNNVIYEITEEMLQMLSKSIIARPLSKIEMSAAIERVEDISMEIEVLVAECIQEAVAVSSLVARNKNAGKRSRHYIVYGRDANSGKEYSFAVRSEKEAREYVQLETPLLPYQEWKITQKDKNTEIELAVIPSSLGDGAK